MALTTQRSTVINLDKEGKPLRPAIVWLDQRRTEGLKPLGGLWGLAFRAVGHVAYSGLPAGRSGGQLDRAPTNRKSGPRRTNMCYLSGYLTYRLTGRLVDSTGCQVGYMPFDYKKLRWASRWDWKWQVVPMEPSILIDLQPLPRSWARSHPRRPQPPASRRAATDRSGLGQSLRGDRSGQPAPAHWLPELRHHRHHQHHPPALYRGDPADPALPGGGAGRLQPGDPDLPRLTGW